MKWNATGWSSIYLFVQNFIGKTLNVSSESYTLWQACDSSNVLESAFSILAMSHPG